MAKIEDKQYFKIAGDPNLYIRESTGLFKVDQAEINKKLAINKIARPEDYAALNNSINNAATISKNEAEDLFKSIIDAGSDRYDIDSGYGGWKNETGMGPAVLKSTDVSKYLGRDPLGIMASRSEEIAGDKTGLSSGSALNNISPLAGQGPQKPNSTVLPAPVNSSGGQQYYPQPISAGFTLPAGTILKQGTFNNPSVKQLQTLLGVTADGDFGPQTRSAVMAFQQKNGLTVDGIVGPQTAAALAKLSSGGSGAGVLKQGQSYMGGIVGYDAQTGKPLKPGETTTVNPGGGQVAGAMSPEQVAEVAKQNEIKTYNDNFNAEQEKDLASFTKTLGNKVDVSDSEKLIKSLVESYEDNEEKAEDTPSLAEQFANKRKELGVDAKEKELNSIDAELAKLDAEMETLNDTENNRQVSVLQINRRKSQQQILYEDARRDLLNKKNSIVNELNQKYAVVDTFVKYADADHDNAQDAYQVKFNQAISLINMVKGIEDDAKSDKEKAIDNARANLTLMGEVLKGQDFDSIDSSTQLEIRKMEISAGLPSGFMKFLLNTPEELAASQTEVRSVNGRELLINSQTGETIRDLGASTRNPIESSINRSQQSYVIQPGDTFNALAKKFGVTVEGLRNANVNVNENNLKIGKTITIPKLTGSYVGADPETSFDFNNL